MIAWIIEMTGADGPSAYYAPTVARGLGHGSMGWTTDKNAGLGFASKRDAQGFIESTMPKSSQNLRPVAHQRDE